MQRHRPFVPWLVPAVLLAAAVFASAQQPAGSYGRSPSYNRPTLSPYLNLFRRDSGPVGRYLSFVRPRIQLQRELDYQNAELQDLSDRLRRPGEGELPPTGSTSGFMTHRRYFGTRP